MSSAVLTSYFTKKKHPNHPLDSHVIGRNKKGFVPKDNFDYIKVWYNSINELNLKGFIFHDDLSEEFTDHYTNDNISFIKTEDSLYSNNDFRFFCYKDFLDKNYFDFVSLSDCSDVKAVKNPLGIVSEFPSVDFFVCKDSIKLGDFPYCDLHNKEGWNNYMLFLLNKNNWDLINMGVVAANHKNMVNFLNRFCDTRSSMKSETSFNANMWVGQYVFRELLKDKELLIGYPFTSEYKSYQNDSKDVYFIHK